MDKNYKNLSDAIAVSILYDRKGIINLLNKQGLIFDAENINNEELVSLIFKNIDNVDFQNSFLEYLKNISTYSNAEGGFFSGTTFSSITSLVGSGLGFLSSSQSGKDAKSIAETNANATIAAAQSQAQIANTNLQIAQLQLQAAQATPKTDNTKLYIGIGIGGALLLGILIFAIAKK